MSIELLLKILLLGFSLFGLIFFIFGLARIDWDTDVEEVLKLYKNELKRVKDELELGNKEIDNIEKEIFLCKKRLGIDIFDKKNKF